MTAPRFDATRSRKAASAARQAVERGQHLTPPVAIFLPGEDVRCVRECPQGSEQSHCGGYLYTEGPESAAHVRLYEPRQFNERRRTGRGNYRCPRCEQRLEVESHVVASPAA